MKRLIFELNEFNDELLNSYSNELEGLDRVLSFSKKKVEIPDTYESDYLEPWSQWVSVHTGVPSNIHRIKHLGDCSKLEHKEIWNKNNQSLGVVWGCLNSNPPLDNGIKYFPDPWTVSSKTNMKRYIGLQSFLRQTVADRGDGLLKKLGSMMLLASKALRILPLTMRHLDLFIVKKIFGSQYIFKHNVSSIYSVVEYLAFKMFLAESEALEKEKITDVFFVNMLAHCQHYYWNTESHHRIDFSMSLIDQMLKLSLERYDQIALLNGLSQEYSGDKEVWNSIYPSAGWATFIHEYVDQKVIVEPCMSYDTNLVFENSIAREKAIKKIEMIRIGEDQNPFFVYERTPNDENRLFVRLGYFGPLEGKLLLNGRLQEISEHFSILTTRSGRHIPECHVYHNFELASADYLYNWELSELYGSD